MTERRPRACETKQATAVYLVVWQKSSQKVDCHGGHKNLACTVCLRDVTDNITATPGRLGSTMPGTTQSLRPTAPLFPLSPYILY